MFKSTLGFLPDNIFPLLISTTEISENLVNAKFTPLGFIKHKLLCLMLAFPKLLICKPDFKIFL